MLRMRVCTRIVGEGPYHQYCPFTLSVRRKGIGTQTLCELMKRSGRRCENLQSPNPEIPEGVDSFTLEVRESDAGAVGFYERLGFKTEGRRKDYYAKPDGSGREDALIMWRRVGV